MSDKDLANFVTYDEVVAKRDELEKERMKDPKDLKLNISLILLCVSIYTPPLGLDWLDKNNYLPRLNKEGNVIGNAPTRIHCPLHLRMMKTILGKERSLWSVVINADKIEAKRKSRDLPRQIMRLNDEIPGVTNGKR